MTELTTGLHVVGEGDLIPVPRGSMYVMDLSRILIGPREPTEGVAGGDRVIVMHEDDWSRLDPAKREALLDGFTRRSAQAGIDALAAWLGGEVSRA